MMILKNIKTWAVSVVGLLAAFISYGQTGIRVEATEIARHIEYLASDALQGRNTPSPGLDSAALYIARHFEKIGLAPILNSYLQDVGLIRRDLGPIQQFAIYSSHKGSVSFVLKDDFVPLETIGDTNLTAPLVFVGYGLQIPQMNYDDYQGLDVKGKIVVILTHYPRENESTPLSMYLKDKNLLGINSKLKTAKKLGAIGAIILPDPLNHLLLKPRASNWSALSKAPKKPLPPLSFKAAQDHFPAIYGGERVIEVLFGSIEELKKLQNAIDQQLVPQSSELNDFTATITTSISVEKVKAYNVMGVLPGNDERLKTQYVVLGAHYDHIGMGRPMPPDMDSIYNGADDNASGTAAVLSIASTMVREGLKPRRSILFALFAGEEAGLLGSQGMLKQPPFPIDSMAAMLNFDMVSRNGYDTLYVGGLALSPVLQSIVNEEIEGTGLKIINSSKGDGFGGSDHAPFLRAGVPALHFFTGLHRDYHQVSDEFQLTNPEKASRVAELGLRTALRVSLLPAKPLLQKTNNEL